MGRSGETHYRGYPQPVGEHLKYLVFARGDPLAALAWLRQRGATLPGGHTQEPVEGASGRAARNYRLAGSAPRLGSQTGRHARRHRTVHSLSQRRSRGQRAGHVGPAVGPFENRVEPNPHEPAPRAGGGPGKSRAADRTLVGQISSGRWRVDRTLEKDEGAHACGLAITERAEKLAWSRLVHGAYLLRTNHPGGQPGGDLAVVYYEPGWIYVTYLPTLRLIKAVQPAFFGLSAGTNCQLRVSGDLNSWTNQGAPFIATNSSMVYPQYWDVDDWNQLFFRLQISP